MKYIIDHDYHIHTKLSPCSGSNAHSPGAFKGVRECFERAINILKLEETDKFRLNWQEK